VRELVDVPLSELTTLRLGGPARRLVEASTEAELIETVADCDRRGEPVLVLGGGSNLVVSDDGYDGTVVRVATRGVDIAVDSGVVATVRVAAGESWDRLVARSVDAQLAGIEALAGIPGSVGATPIQNVGAYGQEVAQTITTVRVFDRERATVEIFAKAECNFTYRHSMFKGDSRHVVLEVTFALRPGELSEPVRYPELARALGVEVGGRAVLAQVRATVLGLRRRKGMVLDADDPDTCSAGSFFTNPRLSVEEAETLPADAPRWPEADGRVKTSAAWLIEHAGFGRGYGEGPVRLSTKHTLALTNRGSARTVDLLALAREIRDGVRAKFGVELVNEPVLVGATL
jgi:UDP-N-acetylmuramate dehydrogenase